jgi:site-specific recombinase XerD
MTKTQVVAQIKERISEKGLRIIQDHDKKFDETIAKYKAESKSKNKFYILEYLQTMRTGDPSKRNKAKKVISKSRCLRLFNYLNNFDQWMEGKDFQQITTYDMREFIEKFESGQIVSPTTKKPYAETTRATTKKAIRKFYKWLKKSPFDYPEEVAFIDTTEPIPKDNIYTVEELEHLRDNMYSYPMKTLLWTLFDSGMRIAEMLNIRIQDIIHPTNEEMYFKLHIRPETTKTYERTVGLFYSSNQLATYLEKYHTEPNNPKAFLFPVSYRYVKKYFYQNGNRILNKSITPHRIRKSSATHYAHLITSYQMYCYRFGWALGSRSPNLYFNRSGVTTKESMMEIHSSHIKKLQTEYREYIVKNKDLADRQEAMKHRIVEQEQELLERRSHDMLFKKLLQNPEVKQIASKYMADEKRKELVALGKQALIGSSLE